MLKVARINLDYNFWRLKHFTLPSSIKYFALAFYAALLLGGVTSQKYKEISSGFKLDYIRTNSPSIRANSFWEVSRICDFYVVY